MDVLWCLGVGFVVLDVVMLTIGYLQINNE